MAEKPLPSGALVGRGAEWALGRFIEANSGGYRDHVYQSFNGLVDVFLARRLQVARQIAEEGGIEGVNNLGRPNGILCRSGLFIPLSGILSVVALEEEINPPRESPPRTRMVHRITAWFGGGMATSNSKTDLDKIDNYALPINGGINLIFTPNYVPEYVGITEDIETSVEGIGDEPHHSGTDYLIQSHSYSLDDQRRITSPVFDPGELVGGTSFTPKNKDLLLDFQVSALFKKGERIYSDWVSYFKEKYSLGTEIRTGDDSMINLLRFSQLYRFVYQEIVGQEPQAGFGFSQNVPQITG